jgi:signal transduction histidine kinase
MNTSHRNSQTLSKPKSWLRRGIHFMYMLCIEPKTEDEDSKRQEFILNTILCCLIPLLIVLDIYIGVGSLRTGEAYGGIPFIHFSIVLAVFLYLLVLSRQGQYKIASYTLLFIYFMATTYGAIEWTVLHPFIGISYVVIIIITSILISTRFSILITVITAITISAITYLQEDRYIKPHLEWKHVWISMHEPIQLSIVFFVIAGISWLSNREMERSLQRARLSEKLLLEERDLLEIKVEERTNELKVAQQDKVSQLYRFAEFGKLSTGVFHDLMNSLNIVVNNVEMLQTDDEQLPEVKKHISKDVKASQKMGNNLGSVRKQIAVSDAQSTFSLEKEINDAVDMVHFKAREANVSIILKIEDSIVLQGNAVEFYRLVQNLLINAIEACEEIDHSYQVIVTLKYVSGGKQALLVVEDNGCGMSDDTMRNIFTQYFTTKTYGKGIGIGLSQTKEIIEKEFHGTIKVQSTLGKGTRFIITIPIHQPLNDYNYSEDLQ